MHLKDTTNLFSPNARLSHPSQVLGRHHSKAVLAALDEASASQVLRCSWRRQVGCQKPSPPGTKPRRFQFHFPKEQPNQIKYCAFIYLVAETKTYGTRHYLFLALLSTRLKSARSRQKYKRTCFNFAPVLNYNQPRALPLRKKKP